jgi:L-aspartate oxidase
VPAVHDALDVLVIGSGVAGLSTALTLADRCRVAVMAKEPDGGGSTVLAQGGIAAALGPDDSSSAHAADTVAAAAGLGDPQVAAAVTAEAAEAVAMLAQFGVHFDPGALAREGGHGVARVAHARGDATGAEISRALLAAARDRRVPVAGDNFLVDLLVTPDGGRVVGALVRDGRHGLLRPVWADTVVLATGGYGQLWASTTSPQACSGDGLAAALRAGAQLADLEFVQFHPTGMLLGRDPRPLASEALRGAGARLRDSNGEYLSRGAAGAAGAGDLAPRDVVSRSMARRMAELGSDRCYLDATMLDGELLEHHFPTFMAACRAGGLAPETQWVPVSPTAHYTMGGVLTDSEGRTTLEGLMAVGEAGCSGLHGANRLASNSLLEGAVMGRRAAQVVLANAGRPVAPRPAVALEELLAPVDTPGGGPDRSELRSAMQAHAGVSRQAGGLDRLARDLAVAPAPDRAVDRADRASKADRAGRADRADGPEGVDGVDRKIGDNERAELRNMTQIASAVVALARRRQESRGAHWRTDFPAPDPAWRLRQVVQLLPGGEMAVGALEVGMPSLPMARPPAASQATVAR